MAKRGPAKSRRPSGAAAVGPHTSRASGGQRANMSATCAAWQKRTACSALPKASMQRPCARMRRRVRRGAAGVRGVPARARLELQAAHTQLRRYLLGVL